MGALAVLPTVTHVVAARAKPKLLATIVFAAVSAVSSAGEECELSVAFACRRRDPIFASESVSLASRGNARHVRPGQPSDALKGTWRKEGRSTAAFQQLQLCVIARPPHGVQLQRV